MNTAAEWEQLKKLLREQHYDFDGLRNQFFRRLLRVLRDDRASDTDRLLAYRDALLASEDPRSAKLSSSFVTGPVMLTLERFGLQIDPYGQLALRGSALSSDQCLPVYRLEERRFIHRVSTDPALQSRLKDETYSHYNGVAQRLAVRLAITTTRDSTLIVNLPTGCGKTLVAHAVSLYAADSQLSVVVVPTIGLAIEQGHRAATLFKRAGLDHGGNYCWHGGQTKAEHDEIKNRIRERGQRILFCSPEAACRSLLPTLFATAREGSLNSVVIDEAHIIDQWGAEFRPYFQILAAMLRSLRQISSTGIKCILMSATFTDKSLQLIEELFGAEGQQAIHVNGAFLRPEVQYAVVKVTKHDHRDAVMSAVIALPKPMIVYAVTLDGAAELYSAIRSLGVARLGLFTGDTKAADRETLLGKWGVGALDIMVATSAFGLGMDKADVRSIIHGGVPENLDRFYQEVGRGGRDGRACESLLIYSPDQIDVARKVNSNRLITVELGLQKWRAMWDNGKPLSNGRRSVAVGAIRADQRRVTEGNEEWNWRTLLLMQRAGLIQIELEPPAPPLFDSSLPTNVYRQQIEAYYDDYYRYVAITPLRDDHRDPNVWDQQTRQRRNYEKREETRGLDELLTWVQDPFGTSLCNLLIRYYTLNGVQPEYTCGGCPHCMKTRALMTLPTVGKSAYSNAPKPQTWGRLLQGKPLHVYIYFAAPTGMTTKRLLRKWAGWLVRMLEERTIQSICATEETLLVLQSEIADATRMFWIGDVLNGVGEDTAFWPQLVIQLEKTRPVSQLGWPESTKILVAPEELADERNSNRRWWQSVAGSVALDNFLSGLNYGDH